MGDYYNQLEPSIKALEGLIKRYKSTKNIEIEIKLGRMDDSFVPGIHSEEFYKKIKTALDNYTGWNSVSESSTVDYIDKNYRKTGTSFIKKEKIENINFSFKGTPYDFRISVAKETPCKLSNFKHTITRKKNRTCYSYKDFRFDLTKVEEETSDEIIENEEFEIELLNLSSGMSDLHRAHSALLKLRDIINICEKVTSNCRVEKLV